MLIVHVGFGWLSKDEAPLFVDFSLHLVPNVVPSGAELAIHARQELTLSCWERVYINLLDPLHISRLLSERFALSILPV